MMLNMDLTKSGCSPGGRGAVRWDGDLFRFMSETVKGTEDLQANTIYHGVSKVSTYLMMISES